ncbi:MAG: LysR substrate-binding domain-containing protein, partial [Gammaproteobacteria bacterium]|nr:LysR substrate-binding domain-containing protein [Gammaproteobacteria bacterium]
FEAVSDAVKTSTAGTARITVAEILAELFPALLSPLQQFNTTERLIELVISNQSLNLLERECDIAIRHVRPVQTELICRKVGTLPFAAWASAGYLADVGEPSVDSLQSHWFIDGVTHTRFTDVVEKFGYEIPPERVKFKTDSVLAQRKAAQEGWGIAGLPVYLGEGTPGLFRVLETGPTHALEVWVVARPQVRHTFLLKQVFDHVAAALQEFLQQSAASTRPPVVLLQ